MHDMMSLVDNPENADIVITLGDGSQVFTQKAILLANCAGNLPDLVAAAEVTLSQNTNQNANQKPGMLSLSLQHLGTDHLTMTAVLTYFCISEFSKKKTHPDLKLLKGMRKRVKEASCLSSNVKSTQTQRERRTQTRPGKERDKEKKIETERH